MAEEVVGEVEAVESVYGDDCLLLQTYPPSFHLHIRPRTADDSSQQFVEAIIGIQAGPKYPDEPPAIRIVDSKGLDEQRHKQLISCLSARACELSSCLMLVALCEEAVEQLSSMNHPDGECPLCLYPLVDEDAGSSAPFMKLMSCFHCFHCECIIRWWNWLQLLKESDAPTDSGSASSSRNRDQDEDVGKCPVCRKSFLAKDIEHVLDFVKTQHAVTSSGSEVNNEDKILSSDSEKLRRKKFDAILKLQQEKGGLIEIKKHEVLRPGIYLPQPAALPSTAPTEEANEQKDRDLAANPRPNSSASSNKPSTSRARNSGTKKSRGHSSRKQATQWVKKENSNTA
uniref:E3 ubiquitin-protein ligase RNF25 isoform X2 n=1 Tax=Nicotiana sylvestris TaxID=4096 RepID=A0A1U7XVQ7_NICSY|nr:PREDICTED: E3 ubiquitin-protein ligase RNF25 isoform X2 [Nicotiana sylvestris]